MHKPSNLRQRASVLAILVAATFAGNGAMAKEVTDADILNDAKTGGDVVSFGLGTQGQRFSPLTTVNTKSVKNLVPAWSMSFGGEKQRGSRVKSSARSHESVETGAIYSVLWSCPGFADLGQCRIGIHVARA